MADSNYTQLTEITRRANLFNISTLSQFVTFSNYGESMTGTAAAVNSKIYPSAFICLYISGLNNADNIKKFIKNILVSYYENKLAVGRDAWKSSLEKTENNIKPLDLLLEAIEKYDQSYSIKYISDIVEQDYNGIWSDFMCSINLNNVSNKYIYKVNKSSKTQADTLKVQLPENFPTSSPYNWSIQSAGKNNYIGPKDYEDCSMTLDDKSNRLYNYNTYIYTITKEATSQNPTSIMFNTIIPLYDRIIDNPSNSGETSAHSIYLHTNITGEGTIYESNPSSKGVKTETLYNTLVPYGMWFSGNAAITLRYNTNSATSNFIQPTWTLTLSSQFKPFPYSNQFLPAATTSTGTASDESTKPELHDTFAQVLAMQNKMLQKLDEYNNTIASLQNEINLLKKS